MNTAVLQGHEKNVNELKSKCYHCGQSLPKRYYSHEGHDFCCEGCQTVFQILASNQLCNYYNLNAHPGLTHKTRTTNYDFLDEKTLAHELLEFTDEKTHALITLKVPSIHCSSCLWLLENLYRLDPGIKYSEVNFGAKTVQIAFNPSMISVKGVVILLDRIGYTPLLNRHTPDSNAKRANPIRPLLYRIGVAGFSFGNLMLLSFPEYLGHIGNEFQTFFGYMSLVLALPLFFYAGWPYIVSATKSLTQKNFNIDVPLALGMTAMFTRSTYEVMTQTGMGYFDSLGGLIFFLLVGKFFQEQTYNYLSFERDYRSYLPMAVTRVKGGSEETVAIQTLKVQDIIAVRSGEVIPADGLLLSETAMIDYSFLSGEADPIQKQKGELIYGGARSASGRILLAIQKVPSQSYITQLWNAPVFRKTKTSDSGRYINTISRYFTIVVLIIATLTALFWAFVEPARAMNAFTAVLIIACPCALAFAQPFTYGHLTRFFGYHGFYLKNAGVIESLSRLQTLIFDKTGTLTTTSGNLTYQGRPLSDDERSLIGAVASQSAHPLSREIASRLHQYQDYEFESVNEVAGSGIIAQTTNGITVVLGNAQLTGAPKEAQVQEGAVHIQINKAYIGAFSIPQALRPQVSETLQRLTHNYKLVLLTGDKHVSQQLDNQLFKGGVFVNQTPEDKLKFVMNASASNQKVAMLGDGLNDAGALKAAHIGIAVSEDSAQFSPASDAILDGKALSNLPAFLTLARQSRTIITICFGFSLIYNLIGTTYAISGTLSPVIAAILMPFSSIGVIALATALTFVHYKKQKFQNPLKT